MAMNGTDKEIRSHTSSFTYNNHQPASSESMDYGSDPDPFSVSGASVTPISIGSRLLSLPPPVRYLECLKNHAAKTGGNITDGCCEFMPSGDDGTLEALKCAACNCHRNFHRKLTTTTITTTTVAAGNFLQLPPPFNNQHSNWASSVNTPRGGSTYPSQNAAPLKFSMRECGVATESSSEEQQLVPVPYGMAKKRFRSKFSQEQKEKMLEFAEKVGWRIPREDDQDAQRFCSEIGVKRHVLKVWMHNNKIISGKKQQVQDSNETTD
ncbi:zinc-finger homeodomain protein 2-like [Rutidosis leptorrhynchoides]|uniref:zinc-finger homeodomain protein 2-like n=1 Tax=Rutidosis leptorrhynchoides TaxID=125765 RepID=UPI003A98F550